MKLLLIKIKPMDKPIKAQSDLTRISGGNSLALTRKAEGIQSAHRQIAGAIAQTCENLNTNTMTAHQIGTAAVLIYKHYYWMSMADIKQCFENGICGMYGQIYGRMDINILMTWLTRYSNDKQTDAEQVSMNQHIEAKHHIDTYDPKVIEVIKRANEKATKRQRQRKAVKKTELVYKFSDNRLAELKAEYDEFVKKHESK